MQLVILRSSEIKLKLNPLFTVKSANKRFKFKSAIFGKLYSGTYLNSALIFCSYELVRNMD